MAAVQPVGVLTQAWEGVTTLCNKSETWVVITIASCTLGVVTKVYEFAILAIYAIVQAGFIWMEEERVAEETAEVQSKIECLDTALRLLRPYPKNSITLETNLSEFAQTIGSAMETIKGTYSFGFLRPKHAMFNFVIEDKEESPEEKVIVANRMIAEMLDELQGKRGAYQTRLDRLNKGG
jgi:hypothetical protein